MAKKKALVTQHLERVSRETLERYQPLLRAHIRGRKGIYALYKRERLYYIGLAQNLRSRLKDHLRDHHKGSWDSFSVYLTIGGDYMAELETLVIRAASPGGNKHPGGFVKSEDLKPKLRKDLHAIFQREEVRLLSGQRSASGSAKRAQTSKPAKSKATGRRPVLAKYLSAPLQLRARHKGRFLRARVRRDGAITFNKKVYNSPSVAGAAAVNRISCNGWTFWTYERSPGDWVPLQALRGK